MRQVISPATAATLSEILTSVVAEGTGHKAVVQGYAVAGKTGTAQKADPVTHVYSRKPGVLSFIGFVPSDAPRLVILALLDEPKTVVWGSEAAAPIFAAVAGPVLRHLDVAPTEAVPAVQIVRAAGRDAEREPPAEPAAGLSEDGETLMPDLTGKSLRQALAVLGALDVDVAVAGRGLVVRQTPAPGTPLGSGASCRLELAPPAVTRPAVVGPGDRRANRRRDDVVMTAAAPREVLLGTLLEAMPERQILGTLPASVGGLTDDSRRVTAGSCFVAVRGLRVGRAPLHSPGGRAGRPGRRRRAARPACPARPWGGSWSRIPAGRFRGWPMRTSGIPPGPSPSWASRGRTGRPRRPICARPFSRLGVSPRGSSGRSSTSCAARPATPARPRPRRSSSRACSPRWWRQGSAASPWRCPRTPWRSIAWTASRSTWPCSRT